MVLLLTMTWTTPPSSQMWLTSHRSASGFGMFNVEALRRDCWTAASGRASSATTLAAMRVHPALQWPAERLLSAKRSRMSPPQEHVRHYLE